MKKIFARHDSAKRREKLSQPRIFSNAASSRESKIKHKVSF
jgi:hypothetical protein